MNDFATNQPAGMAGAQRHKISQRANLLITFAL